MFGLLRSSVVLVVVLLPLFGVKGQKSCGSQELKANVTIPFNGDDVLNREFYESEFFSKTTYGLIDWIKTSGSILRPHYDLKMVVLRNGDGDVRRTLYFATQPNNSSTCNVRFGTNVVYNNSTLAIDRILRDLHFDDSAKNNVEVNFSSHPDKYLLSLVCPDYQEEIHKGTCPVEDFVLMLKVYRPPRDTSLVDFDEVIQLAEADIERNMDMVFSKYENMKAVYLYRGLSRCWNYDGEQ